MLWNTLGVRNTVCRAIRKTFTLVTHASSSFALVAHAGGRSTTLRSVLALEIFHRADAFVAAGGDNLDRPVRWVHAAEISDIARFLSGGELLLTAGSGIGRTDTEQRAYVASIAEVGVAGLAVELTGRVFARFPAALVEEAERRSLPLIGLRHEVPFVEVSSQVLEQLTEDTVRQFARTVEVNNELTERLVTGADHISLVRTISSLTHQQIVLESSDHEVQAYYGQEQGAGSMLDDWPTHARSVALHSATAVGTDRCMRQAVVVQGATWGWLHMPLAETCTPIDEVVIQQGASAIAISLLNERITGARSRHQQGLLINRLMLGDVTGKGFVERALRLGRDLRQGPVVIAIVGTFEKDATDLERHVSAGLKGTRLATVTADIGDAVLTVIGLRNEKSLDAAVRALGSEDRYIGFSKPSDADHLPAAIKQAQAAFLARQPCQFFDRLGILRLLMPLATGTELAQFVEDELGQLMQFDSAHDSQLVHTLSVFLQQECNKTHAAKNLYIQRRTLYYRLEKIGQILGLDLEDAESRLRLQVAIRGAELLHNTRGLRGFNT